MSAGNIYSPPKSAPMVSAQVNTLLASRIDRLKAATIDAFLGMLLVAPLLWYLWAQGAIGNGEIKIELKLAINVFGILVMLLLHGYLWHRYGQSIGKRIVGIKIVGVGGEKPPLWKIVIVRHWVVSWPTFIPVVGGLFSTIDALFIFGKSRRCIHDYIAGTVVVNCDNDGPSFSWICAVCESSNDSSQDACCACGCPRKIDANSDLRNRVKAFRSGLPYAEYIRDKNGITRI